MRAFILLLITVGTISLTAVAQNAERTITKAHTGAITCMTANFNASIAISGGADSRANVWDLHTGSKLRALAAQNDTITDVVFNNDETLFATSSKNKTIVVWDAQTYKPKKMFSASAAVVSIVFHPFENTLLTITANGTVDLWDALNGKAIKEGMVKADMGKSRNAIIRWSSDGKAFAIGLNDKVLLYDADGKPTGTITSTGNKQSVVPFGLSPDAKLVAVKTASKQITIANLNTGQTTTQITEDVSSLTGLQFAQNSNNLLLSHENGDVVLFNVSTKAKTPIATLHNNAVKTVLSIDGNILVAAIGDLSIRKVDVSNQHLGVSETPIPTSGAKLILTQLQLVDENKNGLLDAGEKASMDVTVNNTGNAPVYDAVLNLTMGAAGSGVEYPDALLAGNFAVGATKTFSIPLKVLPNITSGSNTFKVITKSGKNTLSTDSVLLQTGSSQNAGVAVKSFQFYSPSGKVTKGEPITLVVNLENVTRIIAENVQIKFKVPNGIRPIDKTIDAIPKIPPGAVVQTSMQFIADSDFKKDSIKIGFDISGVAYSNAEATAIVAIMGKPISKPGDMVADANSQDIATRGIVVNTPSSNEPIKPIEDGKFIALVIGINDYTGSWPKLGNAVNDAKAVEQLLKAQYGFSTVRSLYDKDATRQKIISELEWLVSHASENDNLIIYYSGHGDFKENLNKGFWVPVDAASSSTSYLISNSDIQTFLSSIPARHTLLISDACFSGDIFRGGAAPPVEINQKYYNRVYNLKSRQAITSGGLEPVMDGGRDNHSVFAYYLLKMLKDNRQKYFDAAQLFDAIKIPTVNNSSQAPKFSPIKNTGDEGGEFVFLKSDATH